MEVTGSSPETLRRQYLLGELSEEERTAFEEKYFRDDEEFEHLLAEEEDLIDAYVRGDLSPAERRKLKNALRFDFRHAPRLSFAEILAERARAATPSLAPVRPLLGWATWPFWKSALAFGGMAVILLLTVAFWFLAQRRLERDLAGLKSELDRLVQLQQQQREQLSEMVSKTEQLASSIEQNRTVEKEQPRADVSPEPKIALATLKRSARGQGLPSQLLLTPDTERVELQVPVEGEYRSLRAVLTRIDGQDVWRSGLLEWERVGSSWIAGVDLPPTVLKEREYVLRLLASERSGDQPTEIGEYYFRVVRK
jgi:hypothetical protein